MPAPKQQSPYDSIFNFIFSNQKKPKKGGKPGEPMSLPPMTGLADGLTQIAMAPWMYPVDQLAGMTQDEIDALGTVKVEPKAGFKVEVGLGSAPGFIANPRAAIAKQFARYKAGQKLARIGGGLKLMDATLFALWGAKAGLSAEDALGVGGAVWGLTAPTLGQQPGQISSYKSQRTALDNEVYIATAQHDSLRKDELERMVATSSKVGRQSSTDPTQVLADKKLRLGYLETRLRAKGLSEDEAKSTAERFWGKEGDDKDIGLWWGKGKGVLEGQEGVLRTRSFKSWMDRLAAMASKETDPKRKTQLEKLYQFVSLYETRSRRTLREAFWPGGAGFQGLRKMNQGFFLRMGLNVGKVMHVNEWLKDASGGRALSAFIMGDTSALERLLTVGKLLDIKFYEKEKDDALIKKLGTAGGTLIKWKEGSTISAFYSGMYYLHPVNLVKGLIWDGRTWTKMAQLMRNNPRLSGAFSWIANKLPAPVFTKFMEAVKQKVFGKIIQTVSQAATKLVANMASGFLKKAVGELASLGVKEIIKQVIIKLITQILGNAVLPGVGTFVGLAIDAVIWIGMWLAEKLLKPFLEFLVLVIGGLIALVLMFIFGNLLGGTNGTTLLMNSTLNPPITEVSQDAFESDIIVDPADWSDVVIPDDYSGSCPAPGGSQRCTQGSHGLLPDGSKSVSAYHQKTRAVDFGLVAGTPIIAPHDGVITISRASNICKDAGQTNYGGWIELREINDDGSSGFTWTFIHVHPAVSSGQTVSKGDLLGVIDGKATAEVGDCWTGPHLHVHVQDQYGKFMDSEEFLNSIGCNFSCH